MENCSSENCQTLTFKCFIKAFLLPKLLFQVSCRSRQFFLDELLNKHVLDSVAFVGGISSKIIKPFKGSRDMVGLTRGWFGHYKMTLKAWKWLKPWHMGTHLRTLGETFLMNTNMTGFRWFLKIFASLCFGGKKALEGLTMLEKEIWCKAFEWQAHFNSHKENVLIYIFHFPLLLKKYLSVSHTSFSEYSCTTCSLLYKMEKKTPHYWHTCTSQ